MKVFRIFHLSWWTTMENGHKFLYRKRRRDSWYEKFDLTIMGIKSHREFVRILSNGKRKECRAYQESKAIGQAYIIEDGWIVRVLADDTRERIKYIGGTEVKVEKKKYKL